MFYNIFMNETSLSQALAFLRSWLRYRFDQDDIPGLSVAIYARSEVVFAEAYGMACLETAEVLTPAHCFGMGSQAKMLTATVILQLVQHGKVNLDDYIVKYLPWMAKHTDARHRAITVRQLLSHSAGLIRDGQEADYWQLQQPFPDKRSLQQAILDAAIVHEPNTQLKYSNLGFALLGQIIEVVSGESYSSYVQRRIMRPLGLATATPDVTRKNSATLVHGYGRTFEGYRQPLEAGAPRRAFAPAVGLVATPSEMCQFVAAYFSEVPTLLNDELKREAQRRQCAVEDGYDEGMEYGLGFQVWPIEQCRFMGHSGHITGQATATIFDPDLQLAVSVACNAKDVPVAQIVQGIVEALLYFERHGSQPPAKAIAGFNTRVHNSLASVEIVATADKMVAIDPDDWSPFAWAEELELVDTQTLRIVTPGSVFGYGELVRYTFADDVVAAINYAGFTLVPAQSTLAHFSPQKTLTLEDLRHLELRLGRVVKAERATASFGVCRLTIDFGQLGRQIAYARTEPVVGGTVVGALCPIWKFGQTITQILAFSFVHVTRRQSSSLPFGKLIALQSDSQVPRTILRHGSWEHRYRQWQQQLQSEFFKFEALPEYSPGDVESVPSLAAWLQGSYNKSRAVMSKERSDPELWIRLFQAGPCQRFIRVRIMDDNPTAYQLWEIERFKRVDIPLLNEEIYLLPRRYVANLIVPEGDFAIYDQNRVMANSYQGTMWTHTTFYDSNQKKDVLKFIHIKQQLLRLAQKKGLRI